MPYPRLALAVPLIAILAACDNSPKPQTPATIQPAAEAPATAAPASPAAAAPLFGTWAAVPANCGTAAITISATRFEGAENRCDITTLADNGDGTFTVNLACTGEGQVASESVRMTPVSAPTGEGVVLDYLDRGGEKVTLLRCK